MLVLASPMRACISLTKIRLSACALPKIWTYLQGTGEGQNGDAKCMCAMCKMLLTSFPGLFSPKTLEMPCTHSLRCSWACNSWI